MSETEKKPVWIACRASPGCTGNWAVVMYQIDQPPNRQLSANVGTRRIMYQCLTCKRAWSIGY